MAISDPFSFARARTLSLVMHHTITLNTACIHASTCLSTHLSPMILSIHESMDLTMNDELRYTRTWTHTGQDLPADSIERFLRDKASFLARNIHPPSSAQGAGGGVCLLWGPMEADRVGQALRGLCRLWLLVVEDWEVSPCLSPPLFASRSCPRVCALHDTHGHTRAGRLEV